MVGGLNHEAVSYSCVVCAGYVLACSLVDLSYVTSTCHLLLNAGTYSLGTWQAGYSYVVGYLRQCWGENDFQSSLGDLPSRTTPSPMVGHAHIFDVMSLVHARLSHTHARILYTLTVTGKCCASAVHVAASADLSEVDNNLQSSNPRRKVAVGINFDDPADVDDG